MATVTVDGKEYDSDKMSDEAKATVLSLQFVQSELTRLEAAIAVYKTAEVAYSKGLKERLEE